MEIIKVPIDDLVPYAGNAKQHPAEQIAQIKESIELFGFNDPIAIDPDNVIIEGHGRVIALQELGWKEVECIRLAHMTDEQRRAYTLIHNKLTMNTGFDLELLAEELKQIEGIDMGAFDLSLGDIHLEPEEPDVEVVEVPPQKLNSPGALNRARYGSSAGIALCAETARIQTTSRSSWTARKQISW